MKMLAPRSLVFGLITLLSVIAVTAGAAPMTSNDALEARLVAAAEASHVTLHEVGRSVEGRPLWAVRLRGYFKANLPPPTVVLLIGQQHGDEPAGAEALLDLIDEFAVDPGAMAADLDLWVLPRTNPDGAAIDKRRNAADVDLNRDHLILSQPETRAIHALAQRIRPHVAVDAHEFCRDSAGYLERGWTEWPLIMMGAGNLPILPDALYDFGVGAIEDAKPGMADAGFNYSRYYVGDAPTPDAAGELRYSTLDPDDCRNGLMAYGCVSFLTESGIRRTADDPHADLPRRVAAQIQLMRRFVTDADLLDAARHAAEDARSAPMPAAIPTNAMWANTTPRVTAIPVIDRATGDTVTVETTTFVHDRVLKSAVPMPAGYLVHADAAHVFAALLDAHGLDYVTTAAPETHRVEPVRLDAVEDTYDALYHRYAGRQRTTALPAEDAVFKTDALRIDLDRLSPTDARRAALILEPRQLFGLYQWPAYRDLTAPDGRLPVARRLAPPQNRDEPSIKRVDP